MNTVVIEIKSQGTKRQQDPRNQNQKVLIAPIIECNKDNDTQQSNNKNNEDSTASTSIKAIIYDPHKEEHKEDIQEIAKRVKYSMKRIPVRTT